MSILRKGRVAVSNLGLRAISKGAGFMGVCNSLSFSEICVKYLNLEPAMI